MKSKNVQEIYDSEVYKKCHSAFPSLTNRVVAHLLGDVHSLISEAESFAQQAVNQDPNDDQAILMLVWCILRLK